MIHFSTLMVQSPQVDYAGISLGIAVLYLGLAIVGWFVIKV